MLPSFYQTYLEKSLSQSEWLTLQILVWLLQMHKSIKIERLAACFPLPILFESRRKKIQRFLTCSSLSVSLLWFPLIKLIIEKQFPAGSRLILTIDRTQWQNNNILLVAVLWKKRALPIYWIVLKEIGSSELFEQQSVLKPVLHLLRHYEIVVIGDREFRSTALAQWLRNKKIFFIFRLKADTIMRRRGQDDRSLKNLAVRPGQKRFYRRVKVTRTSGRGEFNLAIYWRRRWRKQQFVAPWYLITNLNNLEEILTIYSKRFGIEALFRDCKSGGYNLEKTQASPQRLSRLILLIAIAYTAACLKGKTTKSQGIQKYVNRLKEPHRLEKRHSNFWVGLYGINWIFHWELCLHWVAQLMQLSPNKLPFYLKGQRARRALELAF
jgi:Transposase DDE domain